MALVAAAPAAADWPMYGHDLLNTRNGLGEGPTRAQARSLKEKWRFDSPTGDFTGTPVIAKGVVIAGDYSGTVYALDAVTGKVRWRKNVGGPVNGSAAIDIRAPKSPTVYVPVAKEGSPRLVALTLSKGATRWSTVISRQAGSSVYGSPTFWDGRVYMGTSGPNGDGNTSARGTVVALDQATGAFRWQTFIVPAGRDGGPVWSTPAIDFTTGRLYVGTGNAYHPPAAPMTDSIVAIDTLTGGVLGHYQAVAGDVFPTNPLGADADFGASPNLFPGTNGRLLVGEGNKNGSYYAVDRGTMQLVWKTSLGPGSATGGIIGSTAFDGSQIYGTNSITGQVTALGRGGNVKWQSTDGGPLDFSPVAVSNRVLYSMSPSGLLSMRNPDTGAKLGTVSVGGQSFGGIATTGRAVYVAQGVGPPPPPAPPQDGQGAIVAFGDTSRSGPPGRRPSGGGGSGGGTRTRSKCRAPNGARMKLRVRPKRARVRRRVKFRFRATCKGRPVRRATVRFAGKRKRTNRRGRATIRVRFGHRGRKVARVKKSRLRSGRATVRIR